MKSTTTQTTTTTFKTIAEFPKYEISENQEIRNAKTKKALKISEKENGQKFATIVLEDKKRKALNVQEIFEATFKNETKEIEAIEEKEEIAKVETTEKAENVETKEIEEKENNVQEEKPKTKGRRGISLKATKAIFIDNKEEIEKNLVLDKNGNAQKVENPKDNEILYFSSASEANKFDEKFNRNRILGLASGNEKKTKQCGGYIWEKVV